MMMLDHPDPPGTSTRELKERMKSIKILEERNGKLVGVLPPELLLLLLSVRRWVLSRVLVVRSLSIKISASDRLSIVGHLAVCMYALLYFFMSAQE